MFPKDFLWGSSTSSHQVEGNNKNDWSDWENKKKTISLSGEACRHYELFDEDFKIAKELNQNSHRLSIEWSRIQPEKNSWDNNEIGHYKKVIESLKSKGIKPIVTLHHFTNPIWFSKISGWLNKDAPVYFEEYSHKIISSLSEDVSFWITINEPTIYAYNSYLSGIWPPGEKNPLKAKKVLDNMIRAHKKSYQIIHEYSKIDSPYVSAANHMRAFSKYPYGVPFLNSLSRKTVDYYFNFWFLERIREHLDFIGLNYYTRDFVKFNILKPENLFIQICQLDIINSSRNSLGWEIYPEGLFEILMNLKKYKLPVLISENGICTDNDKQRWNFINSHLREVKKALQKDVTILGYLYWSLIDNFEWENGFKPRFGLVEVNYQDFSRKIRESAKKFSEVCRLNSL